MPGRCEMLDRRRLALAALVPVMANKAAARPTGQHWSGDRPASNTGERIAIPGARSIDHAGFVMPNLEQAMTFFHDVLGAALLWRGAPVAGRQVDLDAMFHADPHATSRLAMMRLGPNLNIELVQYDVPGRSRTAPLSSDVGVGHLAFAVEDIDVAGGYLRAKGVRMLEGPRLNHDGPNAGQSSWFFLTPWDMALELVQRPPTMPYENSTAARLFREPCP